MMEQSNVSIPRIAETAGSTVAGAVGSGGSAGSAVGGAAGASSASAASGGIGHTIASGISNAFSHVAGAFKGMVSSVSHFFGGAASSMAASSVAVATAGAVGLAGVTGVTTAQAKDPTSTILSDSYLEDDCNTGLAGLDAGMDTGSSDFNVTDEETCKNCYLIYTTMMQWGLNENQALGVVANAKCESGVKPWKVQGVYTSNVSANYAHAMDYTEHGGGVGLWQFTNSSIKTGLDNLADSMGKYWYDLDVQVLYIIHESCSEFNTINSYKSKTASDSAADCCRWFVKYWERCKGANKAKDHKTPGTSKGSPYYQRWYSADKDVTDVKLAIENYKTNYDTGELDQLATSILANASIASADGDALAINSAKLHCNYAAANNSSIANAALSVAYPTHEEASGNNGTKLYQTVYNNIFSDRKWYMSCDRLTKLAVAWSGSDDNLVGKGDCSGMYSYMESNEGKQIWTKVGVFGQGDFGFKDCQPGDVILISAEDRGKDHGHTMIYVGEEMVTMTFGDKAKPGSNVVEASYKEQSAHCDVKTETGLNKYSVFRCVNPMHSDKYASAGGGVAPPSGVAGATTATGSGITADTES